MKTNLFASHHGQLFARLPLLTPLLGLILAACSSTPSSSAPPTKGSPTNSSPTDDAGALAVDKSSEPRAPASSVPPAALAGAVSANNAFAVDLFSQVRASESGNLLIAPYTSSIALTMTYAGANGETATQMATALHFGSAASTIFEGQNALSQAIASRAPAALAAAQATATEYAQPAPSASDYELETVNSVWADKVLTPKPAFLDTLAEDYGTGVYVEDFLDDAAKGLNDINGWVATETDGKITDSIPANAIDNTTRMVLVDAIHLKMPWANSFDATQTATATFTRSDGTTVSPSFMNQTGTFAYEDDGQAQIVSLPLAGGDLAMVVALPHGGLATYEGALTAASAGIAQPASSALVALSLPKFDFTTASVSLASALKAMGMPLAFDATNADFTGLATDSIPNELLYIEYVFEKSMIAVEETGVEAAGATAVIVDGDAGAVPNQPPPPPPIPVVLNRPFVISLVDVPTGAVLFVGHVEDPTAD